MEAHQRDCDNRVRDSLLRSSEKAGFWPDPPLAPYQDLSWNDVARQLRKVEIKVLCEVIDFKHGTTIPGHGLNQEIKALANRKIEGLDVFTFSESGLEGRRL